MQNPLLESCMEITRAGYRKEDNCSFVYKNTRLISLGNYLLDNSGLGRIFHLKDTSDRSGIALMFGGGIDSYIAMWLALYEGNKVHVVHVDYGQPYSTHEVDVCKQVRAGYVQPLRTLIHDLADTQSVEFAKDGNTLHDMHDIDIDTNLQFTSYWVELLTEHTKIDGWEHYIIPARNLVLAAIGAEFADTIYIVANKRSDENVGTPDKTSRFYRETSDLLSDFYGRRIRVMSPFLDRTKAEAVRYYLMKGGNLEALKGTFSCYTPNVDSPIHCGTCYACYKRYKLFQALNTHFEFASPPWTGPNYHAYEAKEQNKGR
jgi:7-cyano-7-deazaguanine synthase in queuosine biosynthesis